MPRLEVPFSETWLFYLIKFLPNFIILDKSRRASTSDRLVNDGAGYKDVRRGADLLEYYNPKLVITQIGITDCAPRLLNKNKFTTKLLNVSPSFFKKYIYNFLKKHKKRSVENADVSLKQFENNWINYITRAKNLDTNILCILISKPTTIVKEKSPEIEHAINLYNEKLLSFEQNYDNFYVLEPFSQNAINQYAIDEFHVSSEGHKFLFKKLQTKITSILSAK